MHYSCWLRRHLRIFSIRNTQNLYQYFQTCAFSHIQNFLRKNVFFLTGNSNAVSNHWTNQLKAAAMLLF